MVAGPAAADAVRRARTMPGLRVGLHLVVIEGPAADPAAVPGLVDAAGGFPSDQLRLGVDYFFRPGVRRQLRHEIRAQYRAFAATGLPLDHANAHKHMHLHPTVGRMMIEEGLPHGLPALRVPAEPPGVMAALGVPQGPAARALHAWTRLLRRQARRAGLRTNDHAFGIAWSGHMTADRLLRLVPSLPPGLSETLLPPRRPQGRPADPADAGLRTRGGTGRPVRPGRAAGAVRGRGGPDGLHRRANALTASVIRGKCARAAWHRGAARTDTHSRGSGSPRRCAPRNDGQKRSEPGSVGTAAIRTTPLRMHSDAHAPGA